MGVVSPDETRSGVFRVALPDGSTSRRGWGGGTLRYAEDLATARRQCAQAPKGSVVQELVATYSFPPSVNWEEVPR